MRKKIYIILFAFLCLAVLSEGAKPSDFLYGRHPQLTITITPDIPEVYPGDIATFTLKIENRSSKTFNLTYGSGQQWDLAVYHNGLQIYRWSEGLFWADRSYVVPLKSREVKTQKISWRATDKQGKPLPQGVYNIRGMAALSPKWLVSEDCKIRLLPPKVSEKQVVQAKVGMLFDIELPRYTGPAEIIWNIEYKHNRNRLSVHKIAKRADKMVVTFLPKIKGHVEFDLYGHHENQTLESSVERQTYRVEIRDND